MKILKPLLVLPALVAAQTVFAQEQHLKLSDEFPLAGEKISLTYDPAGTVTDGKKDIAGTVFYLDNKNYPADDIELKPDGKLLKGEITVNSAAKAFIIKIAAEGGVDNNNDRGYIYLVYKDKKPVKGAYASEAFTISSGMGNYMAKIKNDLPKAEELYKREFALYPESEREYGFGYYSMLSKEPEHKAEINAKINNLEKSNHEDDLMLASSLLRVTKNTKGQDSLNAVIRAKFPNGTFVKNEASTAFFKEKDPAKKDSIYQAYLKKYPESTSEKNALLDNFRWQLASAYLQKGDLDNYHKYESQLKNKTNLAMTLNNIAYEWAKKGEKMDDAAKMSKQSLDIMTAAIANPQAQPYASISQVKKNYEYSHDLYADTYAYILFKQGKYDEALQYEQQVIDHSKNVDPEVGDNYLQILEALGQTAKAKDFSEKMVRDGHGSESMKALLKKEYIKAKGNDTGYDEYLASLEKSFKDKTKSDLAKTMINQPAPAFTLKDLYGNAVSLADLKGKTVVVDFWATWCGPCKASFPGMQLAVNKYKDDPNVKFLFVDTWENGDNYVDAVKKFIADNKYTFHVLIDEKNAEGKQAKIVTAYEVSGIPTKFIIDKNGNIRFKYIGYSGSADKILDEVTDMIDMAQNPDAVAVVPNNNGIKSK
ncbi:MAG: redoxin domain-containing protein [Bacteroidetes bacterium]|jgi:peroxiredoxin|nr:redoxin domain-containing protein [Bacteroidota bacterium]